MKVRGTGVGYGGTGLKVEISKDRVHKERFGGQAGIEGVRCDRTKAGRFRIEGRLRANGRDSRKTSALMKSGRRALLGLARRSLVIAVGAGAVVAILTAGGCARKPAASASTSASGNEAGGSSNNPGGSAASPAVQGPGVSATPANNGLVGTYAISEVEDKGAIRMVNTKKAQVTFAFFRDGSYARSTKSGDQVLHSDSGNFRLDGPDQLTLITTIENRNILDAAKTKTFKYQLSADAAELRLWGTDGKVALFKKSEKTQDKKE